MAIIKHIASKNADYTEAERYLTFQHDESTGKSILDEDGYMIPREKFLIEGIKCEPSTFARECNKANKQFGKNRRKEDVKSHHYILSFDPKDRELGLTMEQAQKMGMEFAKKHFPGHQALVCTHDEGHNESGNIHVHIVINSLRIHDTEELPYQQRPCDTKAGYKQHCSNPYLSYLQDEVMKMCQSHGLNQVDLKGSDQRVTDAEYHAKQNGQKALDKENAEKKARGEKPTQTTFETEKEKIRKAILDAIEHSADENEFKKKLYEIYGIEVKESRGRWSYLPTGRERPITGKKLGDAFEKAAVINAILGIENGTFDHSEQKSGMDKTVRFDTEITGTESIGHTITRTMFVPSSFKLCQSDTTLVYCVSESKVSRILVNWSTKVNARTQAIIRKIVFLFHARPCTMKTIGNINSADPCIVLASNIIDINGIHFFFNISGVAANIIVTAVNCLIPLYIHDK